MSQKLTSVTVTCTFVLQDSLIQYSIAGTTTVKFQQVFSRELILKHFSASVATSTQDVTDEALIAYLKLNAYRSGVREGSLFSNEAPTTIVVSSEEGHELHTSINTERSSLQNPYPSLHTLGSMFLLHAIAEQVRNKSVEFTTTYNV